MAVFAIAGASPVFACEGLSHQQTNVYGEGLIRAVAGESASFTIQTLDIAGSPCATGGASIEVEMIGPPLQSAAVIDNGDGSYDVTYAATEAGIYQLSVTSDLRPLGESPFKVHVAPGPPSADTTVIMGPYAGQQQTSTVPAGAVLRFDVYARDQFGNDLTYGCNDWFNVRVTPAVPSNHADARLVNHDNGRFTGLVVPYDADLYNVTFSLDGSPVGDSPYEITVGGAVPVVRLNAPPPTVNPNNSLQIWAQAISETVTGIESYQWAQLAGDLDMTVLDTNTTGLHIPAQSLSAGTTYKFQLTVTDAHGEASTVVQFTTMNEAAPGCEWADLGNGICDGACDNEACGGDYGDCGSEFPCPEGAACNEASVVTIPCGFYGEVCEDYETCMDGKCVLECDDSEYQPVPCSEISFSGVFIQVGDALGGQLPPGIGIGASFNATVRIDPSVPDVDPAPVVGNYPGAVTDLSLIVGGQVITAAEDSGGAVVNLNQGYFAVQGYGGGGAGLDVLHVSMGISSSEFVNDSLDHPNPLVKGDFDHGQVWMCFDTGMNGEACLGGYVNAASLGACYKQIDPDDATIIVPSIELDENESVSGSGTIQGKVKAKSGSRVSTNGGDLTLGDANSADGVRIDGRVDVEGSTLTLLDADEVPLNGETTLSGGTVETPGGLRLGPCSRTNGHGTISAPTVDGDETSEIEATTGTLTVAGSSRIDVKGDITTNDKKIKFVSDRKVKTGGKTKLGKDDKKGDVESDTGIDVTFKGTVKGKGKVKTPKLHNHGRIEPGDQIGRLEVEGDFENAGTVEMEIAGLVPEDEHDQLTVTGTARMGGTLDVRLTDGFQPNRGDSFGLFDCDAIDGVFGEVLLPELPDGQCWDLARLYSEGRISVTDGCP